MSPRCPFSPRADVIPGRQAVTWISWQPLFSTFVPGHLRSPSYGSPEDGKCSNTHFEPHTAGLNSSKIPAFMLRNREVGIIPAGNKLEFTFGRLFLWKSERKTQANTQSSQGLRGKEADLMNLGLKRHVCGELKSCHLACSNWSLSLIIWPLNLFFLF